MLERVWVGVWNRRIKDTAIASERDSFVLAVGFQPKARKGSDEQSLESADKR